MYAVNHNLNVEFGVFGKEVMIPDKVNARKTNSAAEKEAGSLGGHVKRCTGMLFVICYTSRVSFFCFYFLIWGGYLCVLVDG